MKYLRQILLFFIPNCIITPITPFTNNPEDFKIEIVPSWFNERWVNIRYSGNKGLSWKYIHQHKPPHLGLLTYDSTYEKISYPIGNGDFNGEKTKWNSVKAIEEYETKQYQKYLENCKSIEKQRQERDNKLKQAYKKANS